jgi:hypothetical protein
VSCLDSQTKTSSDTDRGDSRLRSPPGGGVRNTGLDVVARIRGTSTNGRRLASGWTVCPAGRLQRRSMHGSPPGRPDAAWWSRHMRRVGSVRDEGKRRGSAGLSGRVARSRRSRSRRRNHAVPDGEPATVSRRAHGCMDCELRQQAFVWHRCRLPLGRRQSSLGNGYGPRQADHGSRVDLSALRVPMGRQFLNQLRPAAPRMGARLTDTEVTRRHENWFAQCRFLKARELLSVGSRSSVMAWSYPLTVPAASDRRFPLIATLLLVLSVSGCGGGAPTPATEVASPFDAPTTTTASTSVGPQAAPTVASLVGATTSIVATATASTSRGLDTPDAASQNLWDSWRDNDRARALLFASSGAVDALFESRWQPDASNVGCGRSAGTIRCVYTFTEKTRLVARLVIIEGTDATGYRATRVERAGDLPTANRLESPLVDDTLPVGTGTDAVPSTAVDAVSAARSDATGADAVSDPGTTGAAPTVPGTSTTPRRSTPPRSRAPTKRKPKTTRQKSTTATTVAGDDPVATADQAPAPGAGPVQVGGRTVDTVASA